MNRKFEITTEEKIIMKNNGVKVKVYRIRSLRNFGTVKVGQLGGFVEKEENLSHEGNCFIYDDAVVCEDARVRDDAIVKNRCATMPG